MEPFSTLALVAAFMAQIPLTKRPDWVADINMSIPILTGRSATDKLVAAHFVATESVLMQPYLSPINDRREMLSHEVEGYSSLMDGWDGRGSVAPFDLSLHGALQFIDRLPGGLPLPGAMVSKFGEVGFYWDLEQGYADISFAEDGLASFFSRDHNGLEYFEASISNEAFTREWFFNFLGDMASPKAQAA